MGGEGVYRVRTNRAAHLFIPYIIRILERTTRFPHEALFLGHPVVPYPTLVLDYAAQHCVRILLPRRSKYYGTLFYSNFPDP